METNVKARAIAAVRADKIVGNTTCSVIAECYGDDELVELFDREGATTVRAALAAARRTHRTYHAVMDDRYADARNSAF